METKVNRLVPFKATHPGEVLGEELKARGIKQKAFAAQIGMQSTHLNELIKGKRNMSKDIAIRLEEVLGIPYKTWMNLQNGYEYDCRMIAQKSEEERVYLQKEAAYKELLNLSLLYRKYSIHAKSCMERIKALLSHLTEDPLNLPTLEIKIVGYFKRSEKLRIDERNMRTWLLLAWEAIKEAKASAPYMQGNALVAAKEVADMANKGILSVQRIKECLTRQGIIYVEIEKLPKTPIDAYSALIDGKRAIVVTYRHNDLDKLAFDLLHELCHIDKHIMQDGSSFISIERGKYSDNPQEIEANKFAQDSLIPPATWNKILQVNSKGVNPYAIINTVAKEAAKYGISKSIAVARYKHDTNFYQTNAYKSPQIFAN